VEQRECINAISKLQRECVNDIITFISKLQRECVKDIITFISKLQRECVNDTSELQRRAGKPKITSAQEVTGVRGWVAT
jgi:hypothetical protein